MGQSFSLGRIRGIQIGVNWSVLLIVTLVIWRHRSNIRKLLAGTEDRIGGKQA